MVDLVNKSDFTTTLSALGLWDNKGDTMTSDMDTKYARVRLAAGRSDRNIPWTLDTKKKKKLPLKFLK
jgi:hypothetical protein